MRNKQRLHRKALKDAWLNTARSIYIELLPRERRLEVGGKFHLLTAHQIIPTLEASAGLKTPTPKEPFRKHSGRIVRVVLALAPRFNITVPELPVGYNLALTYYAQRQARPTSETIMEFYRSYAWRKLRYQTLLRYGRLCMSCGSTVAPFHVDHIQPLRKYWDLRLDPENVQVLCELCNHGKGNWDETDFRPPDKIKLK